MPTPIQKFLIAPLKSGLQNNVKPWLIANDAYELLRNAYVWRERLKKRIGAQVMDQSKPINTQQQFTRLRVQVGILDGFGDRTGFVPLTGMIPNTTPAIGQMFSIGNDFYTVNVLGAPANLLKSNALTTTATFDTTSGNATSGQFVFVNASPAGAPIYYYPATPVMALQSYDVVDSTRNVLIAFDRNYSYQYTNGFGWNRSGNATFGLWSGSDSQFHWTTNYRGATSADYTLFVVNNNTPDGIQYFDGTNWFTLAAPVVRADGTVLNTSLITLQFKDRLLFLNTTETTGVVTSVFTARIRFSWIGSPFDATAFREDIVGRGGYIEAPTKEAIISAEFLKDRLIVCFENSTWELVYNNNQVLPFSFQKINTELGVESTHSIIPFDTATIGMGTTGIHACTGINVQRIDNMIPNTIFDISNTNNGAKRVYGIRDYSEELCYWTYPSTQEAYAANDTFPNRMLVYDYINSTWAFNDDSITAFGYFYLQNNLLVWQAITATWRQMTQTWADFASNELFRSVIAGNQQGWTFVLRPDLERNCMALQITDIVAGVNLVTITVINHNLSNGSYIFIRNIVDDVGDLEVLNDAIYLVSYVSVNTITIQVPGLAGVYIGGGVIERVSQIDIKTKQYNLFPETATSTFFPYIDFLVNRTAEGAITVDYFIETSEQSMISDGTIAGSILGNNVLETSPYALKPFEVIQSQYWHRVNFSAFGNFIQLRMYFTPEQMVDPDIVFSELTINAMMLYGKPENSYF